MLVPLKGGVTRGKVERYVDVFVRDSDDECMEKGLTMMRALWH
jgi:hypothetical protein